MHYTLVNQFIFCTEENSSGDRWILLLPRPVDLWPSCTRHDHSFLKVGSVVNTTEVKDMVIYPILDLIVALKATDFATCAKGCRDSHLYCEQCNHQGHFAMLAMDLRGASNKDSLKCWPQRVGEHFKYYNY